jgi:hypothetical protein
LAERIACVLRRRWQERVGSCVHNNCHIER